MTKQFRATLKGCEEVPPVITDASGWAHFHLSKCKRKLHFKLAVHDIKHFTQAHLHVGSKCENGPIVVYLFGPVCPGTYEAKSKWGDSRTSM